MAMDADELRAPRWLKPLGIFALLFFVVSQAIAVANSPADRDMGHLQKIMYVHVPSAWVAMLGFLLVFVWSIVYLWKRDLRHDNRAAATAEVSVMFTGLVRAAADRASHTAHAHRPAGVT